MRDHDYSAAAEFLSRLFGETTEHAVELRALPNDRGAGAPSSIFTRDAADIEAHCARWDAPGRAVYFGAATRLTGARSGSRADVAEVPALWVDIDTAKLGIAKDDAASGLRNMAMPPSAIIDSGGGIHAYWLLREAIDVRVAADGASETEEAVIDALKRLMSITAGDPAVCDLARIMRLPGTHNTKRGEPQLAILIEASWTRYEFDEIVEMLDWHRPVIARPTPPSAADTPGVEADPFIEAAKRFGFKPPMDVEQRLAAMTYLGDLDSGIHQTQLHVSASLVTQGVDDNAIVELLLDATKRAVGVAGANWNWKREERNIRKLIESARTKFVSAPPETANNRQKPESERGNGTTGGGAPSGGGRIIDLTKAREERKEKRADKEDKAPLIGRLGDAVIAGWREARGPIAVVDGQPHTYAHGLWQPWSKGDHHALRVAIQSVVAAARIDPKTQLLNAVYRYVIENPTLMREGVRWDESGLIVCRDGAIDPLTRAICPHSPDHWALSRVEVDLAEMGKGCPKWLHFLETSFSNLSQEDRDGVIATLQEWFGAAMVKNKPRELRKALWLHGESRTGKTRISEVLRLLIGDPTCALKVRALQKNFAASALIGKRGWIADDAVGEADEVDDALFKCIVTGEAFSVDVKNSDHVTLRLDICVLLTSNALPRVRDQSDAVFNRSLLIRMSVVRDEDETAGATPIDEIVAEEELAAVFEWGLEGWSRLIARGKFNPPLTMKEEVTKFKADNNVVASWAKECLAASSELMVDRRDLYASFKGWFISEYGETSKVPSAKFFIQTLRKCVSVGSDHKSVGQRYITEAKLTDEGLIYWRESGRYGENVGSGCKEEHVNKAKPITAGAEGAMPPQQRAPRPPRF